MVRSYPTPTDILVGSQFVYFRLYVAVAELGIKGPLEYLQVKATTLVSLLFYLYDPY